MSTSGSSPAGWYPSPGRFGYQRYWDGQRWTEHEAPVGVAAPPAAPAFGQPPAVATGQVAVSAKTDGKLIAAGVIAIVQAAFLLLFGLLFVSVAQSSAGRFADSITGGAITFLGLVFLGVGTTLLVAGINACRGRNWARILVIVLESIFLLLLVISLGNTAAEDIAATLIPLALAVAALILAAMGKPKIPPDQALLAQRW